MLMWHIIQINMVWNLIDYTISYLFIQYFVLQGIQGNIGPWGEVGLRGPEGDKAPQGPTGPNGVAGYPVSCKTFSF